MSQTNQPTNWLSEGQNALIDLLSERLVIPWFEAESRISSTGWKSFLKVQPLQLHESRESLVTSGQIVEDRSAHVISVVTVRIPVPHTSSLLSPFASPSHPVGRKKLLAFSASGESTIEDTLNGQMMKNYVADMPSELSSNL